MFGGGEGEEGDEVTGHGVGDVLDSPRGELEFWGMGMCGDGAQT